MNLKPTMAEALLEPAVSSRSSSSGSCFANITSLRSKEDICILSIQT